MTERATMTGLSLQPMVHVEDVAASVAFYEALGAQVLHGNADGDFAVLTLGTGTFTLLGHPPNPDQDEGAVEFNVDCSGDLDTVENDLRAAGVVIEQPTVAQGFGRQLLIRSPDGLLIKINELRPDPTTRPAP